MVVHTGIFQQAGIPIPAFYRLVHNCFLLLMSITTFEHEYILTLKTINNALFSFNTHLSYLVVVDMSLLIQPKNVYPCTIKIG